MKHSELMRAARREGWTARPTGGGHWKLTHPDAAGPVFVSATPGNHKGRLNAIADMRRALRTPRPSRAEGAGA